MSTELIILTTICGLLALYASWSFGRGQMASSVTILRNENTELRARIVTLEAERMIDRKLIERLEVENANLHVKQAEFDKQIEELKLLARRLEEDKVFWQSQTKKGRILGSITGIEGE